MVVTVLQLLSKKGSKIYSISSNTTVFEAVALMSKHEVGALLVMDGSRLVGVISERDYTWKVILKDRSSKTIAVQEIMTSKVICVSSDNNIDECMVLMNENSIRHLPVIDNCSIVEVISIMDVIKSLMSEKNLLLSN